MKEFPTLVEIAKLVECCRVGLLMKMNGVWQTRNTNEPRSVREILRTPEIETGLAKFLARSAVCSYRISELPNRGLLDSRGS